MNKHNVKSKIVKSLLKIAYVIGILMGVGIAVTIAHTL